MINSVFYACQGVFVSSAKASLENVFLNGVQSVSVNNNFTMLPIPSMGKSHAQPLYTGPVNEVTIERLWSNLENVVNDEYAKPTTYAEGYLISAQNMGYASVGSTTSDIRDYDIQLVYAPNGNAILPAEALDIVTYYKSLLKTINYEFSIDGPFKENLSFICKVARKEVSNTIPSHNLPIYLGGTKDTNLEVFTRKNFDMGLSVMPDEISDFTALGDFKDGKEVFGITKISVNVDINYNRLPDNGIWRGAGNLQAQQAQANRWTVIGLPISVSCTFTVNARRSFQQSLLQSDKNFDDQKILLVITSIDPISRLPQYNVVDLGIKNRLTSLAISGGSTGGEVVSYDLTYENYNNDFSTYFRSDTNFSDIEQTTEDI